MRTLGRFAGPLTILLTATVAVATGIRVTAGDAQQMVQAVDRFIGGDWGRVFPVETSATSMTAWLLLVGVPFVVARVFMDPDLAWFVAGSLASWPLLVGGMRYALRVLYPEMSVARAWGLTSLALVLPTTLACWFNYYHPQDLAAVGLVFFAFGFAARERWGWAGVMFGFAVLTRQWALLIALAVVPLTGSVRNVVRFGAAGAAVTIGGLLPFVVTGNEGLWTALSASLTVGSYETIMGRLLKSAEEGADTIATLVRFLPLAGTLLMAGIVWVKRWRGVDLFLPLAASVIALRLLFESAPYLYYWAPLPIFLLGVGGARRWVTIVGATVLSLTAWWVPTVLRAGEADFAIFAGIGISLSLSAGFLAWLPRSGILADTDEKKRERREIPTPSWSWAAASVAACLLFVGFMPRFNSPVTFVDSPPVLDGIVDVATAPVSVVGEPLPLWETTGTHVGQMAPLITGSSLESQPVAVGPDGTGKVIVLMPHWHPASQAFVRDLPGWVASGALATDVPLQAVLVQDDYSRGNWPPGLWLRSHGWEYPTMVDSDLAKAYEAYGKPPTPYFVAVDASGKIVAEYSGEITAGKLRGLIDAAIG